MTEQEIRARWSRVRSILIKAVREDEEPSKEDKVELIDSGLLLLEQLSIDLHDVSVGRV
jgi:hypothetical protein